MRNERYQIVKRITANDNRGNPKVSYTPDFRVVGSYLQPMTNTRDYENYGLSREKRAFTFYTRDKNINRNQTIFFRGLYLHVIDVHELKGIKTVILSEARTDV
jgi:hypothetical protein